MDPTVFLDFIVPGPLPVSDEFLEIFDDPTKRGSETLEMLSESNLITVREILLGEINPEQELCDIHTALCPLVSCYAVARSYIKNTPNN